MALPTYLVEIQFGSSAYVDVSAYVQSISSNRGISRALDDFSAGTLSITFVNNARVFDPLNTSSILYYTTGGYTMVQPGGKIRVSANSIRRFTGFIQSWDFTFDEAGLDGKATVSALDEMFKLSNAKFDAGFEPTVQDTGSRIKQVLNYNNFDASEYSGVTYGKTIVGADVHNAGDNVLSYLQNVARSEPADFFSNASAVMVMKDRTFTNYSWANTVRNNLMVWPRLATSSIPTWDGNDSFNGYTTTDGWIFGGRGSAVSPLYGSSTPNFASIESVLSAYEMFFWEINPTKYNQDNTTGAYPYTFSCYLKGSALKSTASGGGGGVYGVVALLDVDGNVLQTNSLPNATAVTSATWTQFTVSNNYTGSSTAVGLSVRFFAGGIGTKNYFYGDGWQFEKTSSVANYFDGTYNPYTSTAGTIYNNGWSGLAYASYSGLVTNIRTAVAAPTIYTFADNNSQGASYGNGTGIPFTDLTVVYGGDQLYNSIQVVGVNATATAKDTALIARYGLRDYTQTDNLATSTTQPATIATNYLAAYKYPEYRAGAITVAVESLSSADQNRVLGIELRDVVRVCFQPSGTGAVVAKYYEVLGMDSNADTERHHITFSLSSLENIASF
jgi:hypothetical protein